MLVERKRKREQKEKEKPIGKGNRLSLVQRIHYWTNTRRLKKLRGYALTYIKVLDEWFKAEGYTRQQRRQYFRELVRKGRFV